MSVELKVSPGGGRIAAAAWRPEEIALMGEVIVSMFRLKLAIGWEVFGGGGKATRGRKTG